MHNPSDRLNWFEAALKEKHPDTSIDELSHSLRLDPDLFKNHISQGTEFDAMAGGVIKGILGCTINEFVENGRAICGQGQPTAPAASANSSGVGVDNYLDRARLILERGGENAEALKTMIRLMLP